MSVALFGFQKSVLAALKKWNLSLKFLGKDFVKFIYNSQRIQFLIPFFPFTVYQAVVGISYAFYVRIGLDPVFSVQSKLVRSLIM